MATNTNDRSKPNVLVIIGATATGKTSLSVELALALDGEIVNGDSRLFYRGMDVATAKPTPAEMNGLPHHLIDILEPDDEFSLAEYLTRARETIEEINLRGKLPIVVGGSGQYIWALLEGWDVPKIEPNRQLRTELEQILEIDGVEALGNRLQTLAPEVADDTDLQNPRRIIRAIERAESGSAEQTQIHCKAVEEPYYTHVIGLSVKRSVLHTRIQERLEPMRILGWQAEVESLLNAGYSAQSRALSGIGYKQMIGHIDGKYDLEEAIRLTTVATNRLVRHQNNWFKQDDPRINWFDMTTDPLQTAKSILEAATDWHHTN